MNRPFVRRLTLVATLGVAVTLGLAVAPAYAQEVVYPDAAYIATAEPVYYKGTPHYWFHDRWFFRDGAHWGWYRGGEPAYLHDYRFRVWPGGVYHPGYHYAAGYHGGHHRR
ncbi:MAG TPA: hypothetical protein VGM06_01535 [Polyangiaceae bacterium]|jgi:hypothetical protein